MMKKLTFLLAFVFAVSALFAQNVKTSRMDAQLRTEQYLFGTNDTKGMHYRLVARVADDEFERIDFSYDAQGRVNAVATTCVTDDPVVDSIVYDENNRVIQINGWQYLNSTTWKKVYILNYTYDADGHMTKRTNFNSLGTETFTQGGVFDYLYNENGDIYYSEGYLGDYQALYETAEYFYDAQHRLVRQEVLQGYITVDSSILYTYDYDAAGRLASKVLYYYENYAWDLFETETFIYDEAGNCIDHSTLDENNDYKDRRIYVYDQSVPSSDVYMPYYIPELDFPEAFKDGSKRNSEEWWSLDDNHVLQYICAFDYVYDNIPASIEEVAASELTVYPNPAENVVTVELAQNAVVSILNTEGRLCQRSVLPQGVQTLSLAAVAPGIYFMDVRYADGSIARTKVIKK